MKEPGLLRLRDRFRSVGYIQNHQVTYHCPLGEAREDDGRVDACLDQNGFEIRFDSGGRDREVFLSVRDARTLCDYLNLTEWESLEQ
jgi:hypothetical protein